MTFPIGAKVLIVGGIGDLERKYIGRSSTVTDHVEAYYRWTQEFYSDLHCLAGITQRAGKGNDFVAEFLYRTQDLMLLDPDETIKQEQDKEEPIPVLIENK